LLARRDDLKGLPLLLGTACRMSKAQAVVLGGIASKFRRLEAPAKDGAPAWEHGAREDKLQRFLEIARACLGKEATLLIRPFEQLYQTEGPLLRAELVRTLARIKGKEATRALARRAVYDLSPDVREHAVTALKECDLNDARPVFLAALRHPWAPVADHAALALVELQDTGAVPLLRDLLDEPDPSVPDRVSTGKWFRKELVRVNHVRNCLLCHPPAVGRSDGLSDDGTVPAIRELLKEPAPPPRYYPNDPAPQLASRNPDPPRVRADLVYFRQDFSVMHKVGRPAKGPDVQRFDYLVRESEVPRHAVALLQQAGRPRTYPQREAVRYALANLGTTEPVWQSVGER
jgi:hypothetical protein